MTNARRGIGDRRSTGLFVVLAMKRLPLPRWCATAAIVAASALMILAMARHWDRIASLRNSDWAQIYFHHGSARDAVLRDGTIDFRSPYVNGGFPLAAHPHDPSLSPLFPIVLLAGDFGGPRINAILVFVGGVAGIALLTRVSLGWSSWGVLGATLFYLLSGWLPARLIGGNFSEMLYFLFPLILFCLDQAGRDRRLFLAAVVLLYLLMCQGNFAYPVVILFLGLVQLMGPWFWPDAGLTRARGKALAVLTVAVLCSCAVGAARMHLLVSLLKVNSRTLDYRELDASPVPDIADHRLGPLEAVSWAGHRYLAVRYFSPKVSSAMTTGAYLPGNGYIGCGLIPLGLTVVLAFWAPKRCLALLTLLLISFLLALGSQLHFDLFYPLSRLPIFHSMSVPLKYFNYFILFFICLGTGAFCHLFFCEARRVLWLTLGGLLLGFAVLQPLSQNPKILASTFTQSRPRWEQVKEFFQATDGLLYENIRSGYGIVNWNSSITIPSHACPTFARDHQAAPWYTPSIYRGEAYLFGGRGSAELRRIGYRCIEVRVETTAPDTLIVNQNFAPGWRANLGVARDHEGLLSVNIGQRGTYNIRFDYREPGFGVYATISVASLLALAVVCFVWPRGWLAGRSLPHPCDDSRDTDRVLEEERPGG